MVASGCPSPEELERLLKEELIDSDRSAVEAHVETCADCQERLERLVTPTGLLTRAPAGLTIPDPPGGGADDAFLNRLRQIPLPLPEQESITNDRDCDGVPAQLGPYVIMKRIGHGGMGTVYRARHRELDKVIALKVLPADRVDEAAIARFRNEMKAAGQLSHPNIVAAHDAGRIGRTYYLAMDIVDGTDLAALVDELGPLPIADACELIRQAAAGLQHACERGFAHRDVKPSNLMLARGGVVKVLDLGLARPLIEMPALERLTAPGVLLGTADYIAPEQIDTAHTADARADVYGLGATLYFLLAGVPPFSGDRYRTWLDKLRAHKEEQAPSIHKRRPDVPVALASLLERMLAKDPVARPTTPGEAAEALLPFTASADLVGLLARAGGSAALRVAAPSTRTAGGGRGVRGAALSYGLTAVAGALIALLAAAPFLGARRGQAPEAGGDGPTAPSQPGGTEEPEGVRLTYGPYGPPRPDNRVLPGEEIFLDLVARGAGKDARGNVDYTIAGELIDPHGQKRAELAPVPFRGPLAPGGSAFKGWASFELAARQPPGEYQAKARVTDHISGRVVNFEHAVYVLKPEFGAVRLRLTHDKNGKLPAGSYLTIGQEFFIQMRIVNFEHKEGRIQVSVAVSARDRDGKDTMLTPMKPLTIDQKVEDAFTYFDLASGSLRTMMAGEVVITLELDDVIGGKKAKYELPVMIRPPRSNRGRWQGAVNSWTRESLGKTKIAADSTRRGPRDTRPSSLLGDFFPGRPRGGQSSIGAGHSGPISKHSARRAAIETDHSGAIAQHSARHAAIESGHSGPIPKHATRCATVDVNPVTAMARPHNPTRCAALDADHSGAITQHSSGHAAVHLHPAAGMARPRDPTRGGAADTNPDLRGGRLDAPRHGRGRVDSRGDMEGGGHDTAIEGLQTGREVPLARVARAIRLASQPQHPNE